MTPEQAEVVASNTADLAILFRLATPTPLRIWSGSGDLEIGSDAIEPLGATYMGVGSIGPLPEMSELINGVAERVAFSFSGSDVNMAAVADGDAFTIRNATINIGILPLDDELQAIATPLWFRRLVADSLSIDLTSDEAGKQVVTVTLSATTAFSGRRRAPISYFTDVDQKRRSPDDRFCERTPLYSQGVTKVWPKF